MTASTRTADGRQHPPAPLGLVPGPGAGRRRHPPPGARDFRHQGRRRPVGGVGHHRQGPRPLDRPAGREGHAGRLRPARRHGKAGLAPKTEELCDYLLNRLAAIVNAIEHRQRRRASPRPSSRGTGPSSSPPPTPAAGGGSWRPCASAASVVELRGGKLVLCPPKSDAGRRVVHLHAGVVDELRAHLARSPERARLVAAAGQGIPSHRARVDPTARRIRRCAGRRPGVAGRLPGAAMSAFLLTSPGALGRPAAR